VAAVVLVALAGCGGSAPPVDGPSADAMGALGPMPSATPGGRCLTPPERAGVVRFRSDNGASLAGALLGDAGARAGVVLAHSNNTDLCDWVPYARVLAGLGYLALSIDLNGYGASQASAGVPVDPRYDEDLSAAVRLLRDRGVGSVFLMGEVIGGTAAVKAATRITPPVAGVVVVSSPADTLRMDAVAAARMLKVPLLCIASDIDEFLADTRRIADAAGVAPEHHLLIVSDSTSGETNLFDPAIEPKATEVRATVESFLRRHLPR
jgi:pimeloyl-ACP methyl ester carboxylesterase